MSVPLSQVKSVCTASELAVVQASRRPELNRLTLPRARQMAGQARKLFDKWQEQNRGQSRTKLRATGSSKPNPRTALKEQIFKDALEALEARIHALSQDAEAEPTPAARTGHQPKKVRAVQHRKARAKTRAKLKFAEWEQPGPSATAARRTATNTKKTQQAASKEAAGTQGAADTSSRKSAASGSTPSAAEAAGASSETSTTDTSSSGSASTRRMRTGKSKPPAAASKTKGKSLAKKSLQTDAKRQLKAATAAKQTRLAVSGLKTRVRGHVSARGKRAQARRNTR